MKPFLFLGLVVVATAIIYQASAQEATRQEWEVYPAKGMPGGTHVTEREAFSLTQKELTEQAFYLTGVFRVTASGEESVVLRPYGSPGGTRVVVAYPPSIPTPAEGEKLVRDDTRGFLIRDIRHGVDGQVIIFAREITLP